MEHLERAPRLIGVAFRAMLLENFECRDHGACRSIPVGAPVLELAQSDQHGREVELHHRPPQWLRVERDLVQSTPVSGTRLLQKGRVCGLNLAARGYGIAEADERQRPPTSVTLARQEL